MEEMTTLNGTARDAKGGAVLVTQDGDPIYIEGLDSWPNDIHGRKITVTGVISTEKFIPDPFVDEDGAISQGAVGSQTVFKNAEWEMA